MQYENDEVLGNFFPCDVMLPGDTYVRNARVLLTAGHVHVYEQHLVLDEARQVYVDKVPQCTFIGAFAATPEVPDPNLPKRRQRVVVETTAGPVTAQVLFGCGCGNVLRFLPIADSLALSAAHTA